MSGKRRCQPCCGGSDPPVSEECGCDGPLFLSITSANATWSAHVCDVSTAACTSGDWSGNGVSWTIESRFHDLSFVCNDASPTNIFWEIRQPEDFPVQFTFDLSLSGDDFPFNPERDDGEACTDTWTPAGAMSLTFESDDLPDGVSIEKWQGTIRNETVFGYPDDRAVMRVSLRIRAVDLFDDWTSLVIDPFTALLTVVANNPQIVFRIDLVIVADKVFGVDDCPSDLDWSDIQSLSFQVEGVPFTPVYARLPTEPFGAPSWADFMALPDCDTMCDTPPYAAGVQGCGGGSSNFDLFTGSNTGVLYTFYQYASWDTPLVTLLDYETAPPFP